MGDMKQHKPKYPVQVLQKSLEIIELLATDKSTIGLGISEISDALKIGKSTVHRILDTLMAFNYVEKCYEANKYHLGWGLFRTGHVVPKQHNFNDVNYKILEDVCNQFHETTNFGVKIEKDIVVIAKYEPERNLRAIYQIGGREPLHATAMGKVLLSEISDEDIQILFKDYEFKKYTDNTITTLEELLKELNMTKHKGYAMDNEEFSDGICCVATPVRNFSGQIVAAVSISAPSIRMDAAVQKEMIAGLRKAAEKMSEYLGFQSLQKLNKKTTII